MPKFPDPSIFDNSVPKVSLAEDKILTVAPIPEVAKFELLGFKEIAQDSAIDEETILASFKFHVEFENEIQFTWA